MTVRAYIGFARWPAVVPLAALVLVAGVQPVLSQPCVGDCNGDGAVTVDEIVTGVNIALDTVGVDSCPAFDTDGSTTVTVDEIITAVNLALGGCAATATPTETPTETPTVTVTDTPGDAPTMTPPTSTLTPRITFSTGTPVHTPTATPTRTATSSVTVAVTRTSTATPSVTGTPTPSSTRTSTPSVTRTLTPSLTRTHTRTPTPVSTDTPAVRCLINSIIEAGEECDDGANRPFVDGCSALCKIDCGCTCVTVGQRSVCSCDLGRAAAINELDSTISITATDPRCGGGGAGTQPAEPVRVEGIPRDLDISPDGRFAFITTQSPDQIVVLDLALRRIDRIIDQNIREQPEAVACSPTGDALFVTSIAEDMVTVLNPAGDQILGEFFAGDVPNDVDVAMTQGGVRAYVTNAVLNGAVTIVDPQAQTANAIGLGMQAEIPSAVECTPDGDYVFVSNFFSGNVSIIDTATNQLLRPFPLNINVLQSQGISFFPTDIAFSPEGDLAYVTAFGSQDGTDAIVVIDTALALGDMPILAVDPNDVILVDEFPTGIAIGERRTGGGAVESNGMAYVTNFLRDDDGFPAIGSLAVVDLQAKTIPTRIPIGKFGLRVGVAPPVIAETTATPSPLPTPPAFNCGRVNCPEGKFCCIDSSCHQLGCTPNDTCVDSAAECPNRAF